MRGGHLAHAVADDGVRARRPSARHRAARPTWRAKIAGCAISVWSRRDVAFRPRAARRAATSRRAGAEQRVAALDDVAEDGLGRRAARGPSPTTAGPGRRRRRRRAAARPAGAGPRRRPGRRSPAAKRREPLDQLRRGRRRRRRARCVVVRAPRRRRCSRRRAAARRRHRRARSSTPVRAARPGAAPRASGPRAAARHGRPRPGARPRGSARRLLQHDVGVGAAEAERAHAGERRRRSAGHGVQLGRDDEAACPSSAMCGLSVREVQVRRDRAVLQARARP